ncbi:MAG: hypothetical protein EBE86_026495 [Hormoscilla sp. GUM202]|nr:hypothetical protein [Hormoscilla sp. GUM202]
MIHLTRKIWQLPEVSWYGTIWNEITPDADISLKAFNRMLKAPLISRPML